MNSLKESLNKLIPSMVRRPKEVPVVQAHHERNQPITVRPDPSAALRTKCLVEEHNERFVKDCFDPSLQPVFSRTVDLAALDGRQLFYQLMQNGEQDDCLPLAYHFLKQHFKAVGNQYRHAFSSSYQPDQIGVVLKAPLLDASLNSTLSDLLRQGSPIVLTEPCWLAAISQAATSQHPIAVKLLAVYLKLTQGASYRQLYQALLLTTGKEMPGLHTWAFVREPAIDDSLFEFAAIQLALARFPRVFLAEILGFTLAYCQSQPLPAYSATGHEHKQFSDFSSLRQSRLAAQMPAVIEVIQDYCRLFPDQSDVLWLRIQTGFSLYQQQTAHCFRQLQKRAEDTLSPEQIVARLFRDKAGAAFGHHRNIFLGDRSVDDWFAQSSFDGEGFLSALQQSAYIDQANPAQSRLLKLFEFSGPMFGVLTEAEKKSLENWVIFGKTANVSCKEATATSFRHTLGHKWTAGMTTREDTNVQRERDINQQFRKSSPITPTSNHQTISFSRLNNRELYYYLVNADLFPEVSATAQKKVHRVLRRARLFRRLPFKHYSHQRFEAYINALYQREIRAYQPLTGLPELPKKAYLWGIEQFAPTILTDGCWLQQVQQLNTISSHAAIGELLFKIYRDEIGCGSLEQNHPYIYRQLLDSLAIRVPPIHSREFADYPGFIDSAFDIPVYLLAISRFPGVFLPELLGLNMAIELSGLGKVYLRLADELTYWDIDPAIVNIHISIDNVASGHAALALKAIQLHLDEMAICYGEQDMQRHWRRIVTGYRSLQTVSIGFKAALVGRYLLNNRRDFLPQKPGGLMSKQPRC